MTMRFKIHPAIGIARLGDSPTEFYLAPETEGGLPIDCDQKGNAILDEHGKEQTLSSFKDSDRRIKRQAARFRIFVYDDETPEGRELKVGDSIQGVGLGKKGILKDIEWTVYVANKKASWYEFEQLEGEHGYAGSHPLRNADVSGEARRKLIIDPGPQTISSRKRETAKFAKGKNPGYAQTFPPPLQPHSIETLGEIMTDDHHHLIVLGGHGRSGSYKTGFEDPIITHYANNDGWFDDIADGPVTAILRYWDEEDEEERIVQVHEPAWIIVGYPAYAPQLVDMITLDDVLYDLSIREFAYNTYIYGTGNFNQKEEIDVTNPNELALWREQQKWWNENYYPYFYKEIYPILIRPFRMQWLTDVLQISSDPHDPGPRGDFDMSQISVPPQEGEDLYKDKRQFIYDALRKVGQENVFLNTTTNPNNAIFGKELMPLLAGDNPISNTLPAKFLRLTDTQLFLLKQWAEGKFINEQEEGIQDDQVEQPLDKGVALDRGVLSNVLGGAFCPGAEVGWLIRNPAVYTKPYRIKPNPAYIPTAGSGRLSGSAPFMPPALSLKDDLARGLEPGDVTKQMAVPWQSDFNECSMQNIDVTYEKWNQLYPDSTNDPGARNNIVNPTLWWPSHRPMQVYQKLETAPDEGNHYKQVDWAEGIPQTYAGDLKMVTAWKDLGFVIANPYKEKPTDPDPDFIEVEHNDTAL